MVVYKKKHKIVVFVIIFIFMNICLLSAKNINGRLPTTIQAYLVKNNKRILVTVNNLRIRQEPNIDSKILGKLMLGDEVVFLDSTKKCSNVNDIYNSWWKIKTPEGLTGWVFAEYTAYPYIKNNDGLYFVRWKVIKQIEFSRYSNNTKMEKRVNYSYMPFLTFFENKKTIEYQLSKILKPGTVNEEWYKRMYSKKKKKKYLEDKEKEKNNWTYSANEGMFFYPYAMKDAKIKANNQKIIVIYSQYYEGLLAVGGATDYYGDFWFIKKNDRIIKVFNNMKYINSGYTVKKTRVNIEIQKDNSGNIKRVKQIYNYIPAKIDWTVFENDILSSISKNSQIRLKKYYVPGVRILLNVGEKRFKEEILDKISNKNDYNFISSLYIYKSVDFGSWLRFEATKKDKERIRRIFKSIGYKTDYVLNEDIHDEEIGYLSEDELKDARAILKKANYSWKSSSEYSEKYDVWDECSYIYNWDKEKCKFVLEDDLLK